MMMMSRSCLETVNGVDGDKAAVWFVVFASADELSEILHLCAIGRDDAHVDALLEDADASYLVEQFLQRGESEFRLWLVDAPE